MNPLPERVGKLMKQFKHVLIPELNLGQLRSLLRNRFLVDAKGLNKVKGQPFTIHEIVQGVQDILRRQGWRIRSFDERRVAAADKCRRWAFGRMK